MARIYISYNIRDKELAESIVIALKDAGHSIWADFESIRPGELWRDVMLDGLKNADGTISILSKNSEDSSWVNQELGYAQAFIRTTEGKFLLPVLFDDINIPHTISDFQVLFGKRDKLEETIERIVATVNNIEARTEAEKENLKTDIKKIEDKASNYVLNTMAQLSNREVKNRRVGYIWYILGLIFLAAGIFVGLVGFSELNTDSSFQITNLILLVLKGIIVIGLLIASSKYAFNLGQAHMNEALRNSDRMHAIAFGQFYLQAFSDRTNWVELKEVFQHWNIDRGASFLNQDSKEYDPKFVENLTNLAKVISQIQFKK